jgi:cyclic pyranopterin phosphate synthase
MPKEVFGPHFPFLPRKELLSYEEIARLATLFAGAGVQKIRLTGGEPLLRKNIEGLIGMLGAIGGLEDLTLTTNGSLLTRKADALKAAGLNRITVSLDSLDDETFGQLNDVDFPVQRVLDGIDAAATAGLAPIKINTVVKRSVNEDSILQMAGHFRGTGHIVRFIEFMDVGHTNGWQMDEVVSAAEIVERIDHVWPLEPAEANYPGEVASRYRYKDGAGEIGIIASVTQAFCGACTRARLSADGKLYTCLFGIRGHDFRGPLRDGATDEELTALIERVWSHRTDRYSELRSSKTVDLPKVEMSYIGG